jgi:hypothetical protein
VDPDPLRDLERRLDRLAAKIDLDNQSVRSEIEGMRDDIKRLEAQDGTHVPLVRYLTVERVVFGMVGLILIGFVTAMIAVVVK